MSLPRSTISRWRAEHGKGPLPAQELDTLLRPKGCLYLWPQIPPLYMGWKNIRIHKSSIWLVQYPSYLHKAVTTSNGTPALTGTMDHYLSRRHADHAPIQGEVTTGGRQGRQFSNNFRVHNKPHKVSDVTHIEITIILDITQMCQNLLTQQMVTIHQFY